MWLSLKAFYVVYTVFASLPLLGLLLYKPFGRLFVLSLAIASVCGIASAYVLLYAFHDTILPTWVVKSHNEELFHNRYSVDGQAGLAGGLLTIGSVGASYAVTFIVFTIAYFILKIRIQHD